MPNRAWSSPRGRRRALTALLIAAAAAAPAAAAEELAAGTHLVRGAFVPGRQPDGNSVLIAAPEGWIVVDTGRHPAHTRAVLDLVAASGRPVAAIVNTHWHLDHVGGNAAVRAQHPGARLYATDAIAAAREGFLARYRGQLAAMAAEEGRPEAETAGFRAEIDRIDTSAAMVPDLVLTASGVQAVAGRPLELRTGPGATERDLWLLDPATGVLVAGDLVTLPAPFFDTACPSRWQQTLAELAATELRVLVPGHGPPLDRDGFGRYRRAFDHLLACAASERDDAACTAGWLADAGDLVTPAEEPLARDLLAYYLSQVLRDPTRRGCGGGA